MAKKTYFESVDPKVNFPDMEKRLLESWYKSGVVRKYLVKNKSSKKRFSFLDGPITANNPMGVHHAWGRTYKDLWQRFKNMQGFSQRFQNGFDCQGLWVEVEVEKALGFNSKKDIEKYGLDNFTNACKDRVYKFAEKQTEQSKRLGYFMDWENSYYTMSETNNLYIWRFLKTCHEKGLIFKNKSATTWCPRCETGLSRHEQADSYKDITDTAVYFKCRLKGRKNEYFLVWTTTPWTISANVLLAINPEHKYVKARVDGEIFHLAKEASDRLGLKDYSLEDAKNLLGLEYESVYDIPAQEGVKHYVVEWDQVSSSEGTGIVHIAPGCGEEDFELGKKLGATVISPLSEAGIFAEGFGELTGKYAHEVSDKVIDYLKSKNSLFKTENFTHSYPHCWRCKTKCLFRLEENWFIDCHTIREGLKNTANKANWIPKFVGKRMQNWLDNMEDWMISRKRFYGLSLPFYECGKCSNLIVVGSKEELRKLSIDPSIVDKLPSLHRPWVDEVKIKCPKCGEAVSRVKDVGDCWLDAGVVPFSTLKYFEDKDYWTKWYPAEFICEMVEQVRLWYYSMLVYGHIFEGKVPYRNVLNYVEVRDEGGERMSKTKGNGIPYDEAVESMGADVMRWMYVKQNPTDNLLFGYKVADEVRRQFLLKLWNVYNFFVTYANLNSWSPSGSNVKFSNVLDRWILARLNETLKVVTGSLEKYDAYLASSEIEKFVDDLSNWYVRRSRKREDNKVFYAVLYKILTTLCKILAPFTPFVADEMYRNLTKEESVHLTDWPEVKDLNNVDLKLVQEMAKVRQIVEKAHAIRKEVKIPVRQPLSSLATNYPVSEDLRAIIKDEINVKEIIKGKVLAELDQKITTELRAEGAARELVRKIQEARKNLDTKLDELVDVTAPEVPSGFEEYIKSAALVVKLQKGDFKVTRIK